MDDDRLEQALQRSENALRRIGRSLESRAAPAPARDDALRAKVRDAIAELDQLIREAAH